MAKYPAIATVGMTILDQLASARPKPEFANTQFELYQSSDFESSTLGEGISLYLYRVAVNGSFRNPPGRMEPTGKRRRPPLPLDLHFMLTAWAKTAAKQHHLLAWAMQQLEDTPVLPSGLLNSVGPPGVFYPDETVEVICDMISMQDMISIWDNLKATMQISATYVARMVMIESALELVEAEMVQTRNLKFAQGTKP